MMAEAIQPKRRGRNPEGQPAKNGSERVTKLRDDRAAKGIKRLEVYAHTSDHEAIRQFAAKLSESRRVVDAA